MQAPQARMLPDGKRLHLNHGPIDLIIEAFGELGEVQAAYSQAAARFQTILTELVAELWELRTAVSAPRKQNAWRGEGDRAKRRPGEGEVAESIAGPFPVTGSTARRMYAAVTPHAENFITPMAAVAGSVADEIMAAMVAGRLLEKAYVNNGGDVAIYLRPHSTERVVTTSDAPPPEPMLTIAIAGTGHGFADRLTIRASDPVRGIATSGWRGRSFSLGIADAVTVLARTAAAADAAATVIANAVDLPGNTAVSRRPANELAPDSDLGELLVTVDVRPLMRNEVATALDRGLAVATALRRRGLIQSAALFLAGVSRVCGELAFQSRAGEVRSPRQVAKPRFRLSERPRETPKDHPHA